MDREMETQASLATIVSMGASIVYLVLCFENQRDGAITPASEALVGLDNKWAEEGQSCLHLRTAGTQN